MTKENYLTSKLWPALAVIVTILVFLPSINYQFLTEWDDGYYVSGQHLQITLTNICYWLNAVTQKLYTPVSSYSLMIDYNLFANNSTGYHLHNLLLHCGSVLFFIAIMRQFKISPVIASGIALLWAIHPQRVPSVVWIAERKDVLVVFFALASFYAFMRACKKQKFSFASPLLLLLSLGAKPAAVALPIVMLIYACCYHRKYKAIKWAIPSFATLILYLSWFFYVQSTQAPIQASFNFLQKFWIVPHNIMWYFSSALIPFQLNPIYPRLGPLDISYLPLFVGFFLLIALLFVTLITTNRLSLKLKIYLSIALFLSWGALFAPISGLLTIGAIDYADRYNYLPSLVIWLMIAIFFGGQLQKKWIKYDKLQKFIPLAFLLVLFSYWHLTWSYMPVWSNCENLFFRSVQWQYPNIKAIDILGTVAITDDNPQLLAIASEKYLTIANAGNKLSLYPEQIHRANWQNAGLFLGAYSQFLQGNLKASFPVFLELEKRVRRKKLSFYEKNGYIQKFWMALASCYLEYKQPKKALICLQNQLFVLKSDSSDALFNKGLAAFIKKDFASAKKHWEAANKLRPDDEKIIYNINIVKKLLALKQR